LAGTTRARTAVALTTGVAVRQFQDANGREWRAWEIKPAEIYPATKAEDWLADCYITGWIVFETIAGDEKRRLCPWPINWAAGSDDALRDLLARAEQVLPGKSGLRDSGSVPRVETPGPPEQVAEPDPSDLNIVRGFRYPGGRYWAVGVIKQPDEGTPPVLRFTAGLRHFDAREWPADWADLPEEELVNMLRLAAPRAKSDAPQPGMPRRRWSDQRQSRG
jgi:hypothetical protein